MSSSFERKESCRQHGNLFGWKGAVMASLVLLVGPFGDPAGAHVANETLERGFSPQQVYQLNGLDNVNLFNGNLNVTIPIGPSYPVGGGFSYQLKLVYNSQIWDFEYDYACTITMLRQGAVEAWFWDNDNLHLEVIKQGPSDIEDECFTVAIPNRKSNAGTGWTLGFGQLYPPNTPETPVEVRAALHGAGAVNDLPAWVYVSPAGSEHTFFGSLHGEDADPSGQIFYTRDGSFLRLAVDQQASTAEVHSPDGIVSTFEQHVHWTENQEPGPETHWRLVSLEDPFGNAMMVSYVADSDLEWEITDTTGRTHSVVLTDEEFADPELNGEPRRERVIDYVELASPGVGTSIYDFRYGGEPEQHQKPGAHEYPRKFLKRGCPNTWEGPNGGEENTFVLQLQSLVQPDGTIFDFTYVPPGDEELCSHQAGRLSRIDLPTGGALGYEYGGYLAARNRCSDAEHEPLFDGGTPAALLLSLQSGVVKRHEIDEEGVTATWRYLPALAGDVDYTFESCDMPKTAVRAVVEPAHNGRQRATVNYFSIFRPGDHEWDGATIDPDFTELGWDHLDYALPFTRESVVFGEPFLPSQAQDTADPKRFVSREVYSCSEPDSGELNLADVFSCIPKRRTFVRYERDESNCLPSFSGGSADANCTQIDRRLADEMTYFLDDEACNVAGVDNEPCWRGVLRSGYDGLGHYRFEESVSGFGPTRTAWTNFNAGISFNPSDLTSFDPPSPADSWILGTFKDRKTSQGTSSFVENFVFEPSTGFLTKHERVRGGTDPSLVATYGRDSAGNLTSEEYSRGAEGDAEYVVAHQYAAGVLSRSEYRDPALRTRTVLRTVDRTIDPATGLVTASRDSANVETTFEYDGMWRLKTITPADSRDAKTTYEYVAHVPNEQPALVRVLTQRQAGTLDVLTKEEYEYDGLGRVSRARTWMPDGVAAEVATEYSLQGWVVRQTTPYDAGTGSADTAPATRTTYDVFGRPIRVIPPDGSFAEDKLTKYEHKGARQTIRTVRGVGPRNEAGLADKDAATTFEYDHLGRLVALAEPSGAGGTNTRWRYTYDEGGRLATVKVGSETVARIAFDYDPAGLLLSETHPELADVKIFHLDHDARGHARSMRYGTGSSFDLDFAYDAAERLVRVTKKSTQRPLTEHFYGAHGSGAEAGKLVDSKRHNDHGENIVVRQTNFYEGPSGRLSSQRVSTGGARNVPRVAFWTAFDYDPLGNVAQVEYPDCSAFWCFETTESGQWLRDESVSPLRTASYQFRNDLLTGVSSSDTQGSRTLATLGFHRDGLLASIAHGNGATDTIVGDPKAMARPASMSASAGGVSLWSSGTYAYDTAGNIRSMGSDTFDYDLLHRLTSANGAGYPTQSFSYDAYGNMTTKNDAPLGVDSKTNRIDGWTYDLAGNVVKTGGDYTYAWDALGAMTRATRSAGGPDVMHLYDAAGERVAKFHLSGGQVVRELWSLRGLDDRVLRDVEYMPRTETGGGWRWLKDYVHRGGGLLASFGPTEGERHYHLDHLGTTRAISDQNGNRISQHKYLPFGEEINPTDITTERLRFTGHERDDLGPDNQLSDLDYMHARYYRPSAARFLSVDPVLGTPEEPQGWNRYSYTRNRPLTSIDPSGRVTIAVGGTGDDASWAEPGTPMNDAMSESFGEPVYSMTWALTDGLIESNNRMARREAAEVLVDFIVSNVEPGEAVNLVGFSHGGNVIKSATNMLAEIGFNNPLNVILLGTPHRPDYEMSMSVVESYINVHSRHDHVQRFGGMWFSPIAARTDSKAVNLEISRLADRTYVTHTTNRAPSPKDYPTVPIRDVRVWNELFPSQR